MLSKLDTVVMTMSTAVDSAHLSVAPAHLAAPLHAALQADGTPRYEVFTLHTHAAASVTDLQHRPGQGAVCQHTEVFTQIRAQGSNPSFVLRSNNTLVNLGMVVNE